VALDQFVLWVNADAPYKTVPEFLRAAKGTDPQQRFRMGGTGVRQEDKIIIQAIQRVSGAEFAYVAHRGGAEVASQLLAGNLEGSVNNPIEALPGWRAGGLRPLCVFNNKRLASTERPTITMGWSDIPTCKEAGLDVEYEMVRTVFMAPGVEPAQTAYYVDLLRRVRETPEWKAYMQTGAYDTTFLTGEELRQRLAQEEERHRIIVSSGGLSIHTMQSNAPLGLGSAEHGNEN
jgi:putative tricarboxylic transport membrane protein